MNKTTTTKKPKSERLGWERYSTQAPVSLRDIVGEGVRVEKNTYRYATSYKKLVP